VVVVDVSPPPPHAAKAMSVAVQARRRSVGPKRVMAAEVG
jgi:hypothetical protein